MSLKLQPIRPRKFNGRVFVDELAKSMKYIEEGIKKDYEAGVKTWDTKVEFTSRTEIDANRKAVRVHVETNNEIYGYVHDGTRPHPIKPKKAKKLHFKGVYSAKTVPGVIQSKQGGASGPDVFSTGVQHPGFKGRLFSVAIKKRWQKSIRHQTQRALDKAAKESGHGA